MKMLFHENFIILKTKELDFFIQSWGHKSKKMAINRRSLYLLSKHKR